MKTMEFCSGSMLHGFQGIPWNFPHAFSMVFPWISHAFSTRGCNDSKKTVLKLFFIVLEFSHENRQKKKEHTESLVLQ